MEDLRGRLFQLWDYSPSLQRLLIRSPRKDETEVNLDIIFWGVKYINLITNLGEISIQIGDKINETASKFIIRTSDQQYIVEATTYKVIVSDTDIFDSPLDKI